MHEIETPASIINFRRSKLTAFENSNFKQLAPIQPLPSDANFDISFVTGMFCYALYLKSHPVEYHLTSPNSFFSCVRAAR